jgi:hypothetical protein
MYHISVSEEVLINLCVLQDTSQKFTKKMWTGTSWKADLCNWMYSRGRFSKWSSLSASLFLPTPWLPTSSRCSPSKKSWSSNSSADTCCQQVPQYAHCLYFSDLYSKKVKFTLLQTLWPWRGGRGIALLILNLGTRRGWVVSTTPWPLYPRERPGTHSTEGWVGPRASLDVCEKSRPHRDSISGLSSL